MKKDTEPAEILAIQQLDVGYANFCLLGQTPLIMNRMGEKARQELLFPRRPLSRADKAQKLKHDPLGEFRSALYAPLDRDYPTRLIFPANGFRRALADAALDTPGATKTEILRLVSVLAEHGTDVCIYGLPELYMAPVCLADRNRTKDMRTRGILRNWAAYLRIRFIRPTLTTQAVGNLLANAGILIGIGDNRQQKGGSNGLWELVSADDEHFLYLIKNCARGAQDEAIANPSFFDSQTEADFVWFQTEIVRRERTGAEKISQKKGRIAGPNSKRPKRAAV